MRRGGRVTEVSPTHYKVRGLSDVARLGDIVEQRSHAGTRRGEIVRIGRDEVVVAPSNAAPMPASATPCSTAARSTVTPHASWRGRAIDALARADRRRSGR